MAEVSDTNPPELNDNFEPAGRPADKPGAPRVRVVLLTLIGMFIICMGIYQVIALAAGWSDAEMVERFHRTFVATNPLSDYTLPVVSLVAGRKVELIAYDKIGGENLID
mgnify:CR=1 FL=1